MLSKQRKCAGASFTGGRKPINQIAVVALQNNCPEEILNAFWLGCNKRFSETRCPLVPLNFFIFYSQESAHRSNLNLRSFHLEKIITIIYALLIYTFNS